MSKFKIHAKCPLIVIYLQFFNHINIFRGKKVSIYLITLAIANSEFEFKFNDRNDKIFYSKCMR